MAHVELSLSEPFAAQLDRDHVAFDRFASIDRWSASVRGAAEPCLVIDDAGAIAAVSISACNLLGFASPDEVIGRVLHSGDLLALVDFTPAPAALSEGDMEKIPPLLALSSGRLARGLMRVRSGAASVTMDAVATPLWDRSRVVGSLTFFCLV